jgi:DNA-binding winged helix-turn-helix (wHTH) protein
MVSSTQYKVYRFGSFALDLKRGALLAADGAEIPLRPKSFSLLRLLVESAGQLLSKEAIMEMIWPNVFVTENNITQCIHEIRHALGSEADQILRTRPCRGYIFTSDVIMVPPAGLLVNGTIAAAAMDPAVQSHKGPQCPALPGATRRHAG